MYKVRINGKHLYAIGSDDGNFIYDGEKVSIDHQQLNGQVSHVLYKDKSYQVELIEHRKAEKTLLLKVNSKEYLVEISDQYDELLHKLGFDRAASHHIKELKAPMPGMVLNVLVKEGEEVKKGDSLVILEAMKMENVIKAPADCVIKDVKVVTGDKVEKNQVMMGFA
jgi:biotin carboxyl carrier protein